MQQFYRRSRLVTEIQCATQFTFFRSDDRLLAQQERYAWGTAIRLLATDRQHSVLHGLAQGSAHSRAYDAHGYHRVESGLSALPGFNGERRDPATGYYLLGNGYRAFNPVLMRFNSPDSLSPFGEGGLNAYAYCWGDPVNGADPSGHMFRKILPKPVQPSIRPPVVALAPVSVGSSVSATASTPRPVSPQPGPSSSVPVADVAQTPVSRRPAVDRRRRGVGSRQLFLTPEDREALRSIRDRTKGRTRYALENPGGPEAHILVNTLNIADYQQALRIYQRSGYRAMQRRYRGYIEKAKTEIAIAEALEQLAAELQRIRPNVADDAFIRGILGSDGD